MSKQYQRPLTAKNSLIIPLRSQQIEEPFYLPRKEDEQDAAREAHAQFYHASGDHLTLLNTFEAWRETDYSKDWCHENYLNLRHLRLARNIRSQLRDIVDRNSLHDKDAKRHDSKDTGLVQLSPEERSLGSPKPAGNSPPLKASLSKESSSRSLSSSRSILQAFSAGYGVHLSKKHPHRQMFYHYLASSSTSPAGKGAASSSSLLALHISPLSALYLDDERSMTKHGRKVARDLEWIFYHEVVYHVKAVMRYVSKMDLRWAQETLDRARIYDDGSVWLNGERSESPSANEEGRGSSSGTGSSNQGGGADADNLSAKRGPDHQDSIADEAETGEQAKKRARLALVEAARQRALERRQNQ